MVEDEPLVAMLLEDMLVDLGFEVVGPALRFDRAMELAAAEAIDAAILDVNLGSHRSDAVAAALRERGVPFLYATGYGSGGVAAGDAAVIRKPFQQDQIASALARLMEGAEGRRRQAGTPG
ncbi:response regulator [Sphingosinicella terrae]|uniref:response regulator n=1 Tax=Sphingosinicella terrae TaxID=2172047 RepID=UPI002546A2C1|nr:response regulator [Sphingosinicella terrae]